MLYNRCAVSVKEGKEADILSKTVNFKNTKFNNENTHTCVNTCF